MKRFRKDPTGYLIFFLASMAIVLAGFSQTKPPLPPVSTPPPTQHALTWKYPTNAFTPDLVFWFFETTVASQPQPWPVYGSVSITNLDTSHLDATGTNSILTFPLILLPGQYFFYATASNFWSVSIPSNTANTPPFVPLQAFALNIQ